MLFFSEKKRQLFLIFYLAKFYPPQIYAHVPTSGPYGRHHV